MMTLKMLCLVLGMIKLQGRMVTLHFSLKNHGLSLEGIFVRQFKISSLLGNF